MSDTPLLVVVTGPPASGKSSIARRLAAGGRFAARVRTGA
jgi:dephospho-CoA kinase